MENPLHHNELRVTLDFKPKTWNMFSPVKTYLSLMSENSCLAQPSCDVIPKLAAHCQDLVLPPAMKHMPFTGISQPDSNVSVSEKPSTQIILC
jgi:hypothetical protein